MMGQLFSFSIQNLESQITELQSETTRLLSTLETQKTTIENYQEQSAKMEAEYTRQTQKLQQEIFTLKEKVVQYADYDEIKRELEIIKVCHRRQIVQPICIQTVAASTNIKRKL
jgi:homeobox protein cut-like